MTAFGDRQYTQYWITDFKGQINIRYLFKGELPDHKFQSYYYLQQTHYIMLISREGFIYGKIIAEEQELMCSYLQIHGD